MCWSMALRIPRGMGGDALRGRISRLQVDVRVNDWWIRRVCFGSIWWAHIEVIIVPDTQEEGVGMFWEGGISCLRCTV